MGRYVCSSRLLTETRCVAKFQTFRYLWLPSSMKGTWQLCTRRSGISQIFWLGLTNWSHTATSKLAVLNYCHLISYPINAGDTSLVPTVYTSDHALTLYPTFIPEHVSKSPKTLTVAVALAVPSCPYATQVYAPSSATPALVTVKSPMVVTVMWLEGVKGAELKSHW